MSFVAMMAVGGVLGMAGVDAPFAEFGIGLSVAILGLVVAADSRPSVAVAMALVGVFAFCHGQAHGAEMPQTASGLAYGAGFIAATSLLHAVGIGLGLLAKADRGYGKAAVRAGGAAMAIAGAAILAGAV